MPAEALLWSSLQALINSLASLVLQQLGDARGLQGELKKLERTVLRVQSVVGDAEEKQVKDPAIKKWLTDLKDAAYEAEDVLDEFYYEILWKNRTTGGSKIFGKVRDFFSPHNPLYVSLNMASKLRKVVESIDGIETESSKFNFTPHAQPQTRAVPETHPYVIESDVIGRDMDKKHIVKLLIDNAKNGNIAVLPIVGMGGLGKTTLAQLIYNDQQIQKHFQLHIWVCVSDVFDIKDIVKAIISSATGTECTMDLLQRRARDVLTGKRYLLVLDDVWNEDPVKWDSLKALLDCGGDGSTLVVTTRTEQVASIVGTVTAYQLKILSDDDSWDLFRKRAFATREEGPQNLVEIGKAIVKKCGGLPLAVKVLGSLMSYKSDEKEWYAILGSDMWDTKVGEDNILPSLRLSYNNLPSHLKRCFAFCAIFPKDLEMEEDMLIQLWMAQGFIPSEGTDELEVEGHEIFMELVHRSFFQDVRNFSRSLFQEIEKHDVEFCDASFSGLEKKGYCKMHDLIHDLAQHVTGEECVALQPPYASVTPTLRNVHHLFTDRAITNSINEILTQLPVLRTLLVRDAYNGKTFDIISKPTALRVLALPESDVVLLKYQVQHLKHVRYLDLSNNIAMSELPEAATTLLHLQTLELSYCRQLRKLPSGMKNMINLRHLYLDRCRKLQYMPKGLGRLSCLHTLTKYVVGDEAGSGIGELKRLNLSGQLELYNLRNVRDAADAREANLHFKQSLHTLAFCWGVLDWTDEESLSENAESTTQNAEEVLEGLKAPSGVKALLIWGYGGVNFPTWISHCYNLVEIRLGGCRRCQHLPSFWRLPSLKVLSLRHMDAVKHIICSDGGGNCGEQEAAFPVLKKLVLEGMPSLEEWWEKGGGAAAEKCFPCLTDLIMSGCPKLRPVPLTPSLRVLKIPADNRMLLGAIKNSSTLVALGIGIDHSPRTGDTPSSPVQETVSLTHLEFLEHLQISGCNEQELQLVQEDDMEESSLGLRELIASNCDWLFTPRQFKFWKSLVFLRTLKICNCDGLSSFPEEFQGLKSLKSLVVSNCVNLTDFSSSSSEGGLPTQLEYLRIYSCSGLKKLPRCPASLKELDIFECSSLILLTEDLSQLTSLEDLFLNDCPNLSSLPEQMMMLSRLEIHKCPKLRSLPEGLRRRLPSLEFLVIRGCPKLERQCRRGAEFHD